MSKSRPQEGSPTAPLALIKAGQHSLEAVSVAHQHLLQRTQALYEEAVRFGSQRMDENRRALEVLSKCLTLPDALSAWTDYLDRTTRQYGSELEALAGICSDQAREALDDIQREVAVSVESPQREPAVAEA